MTSPNHYPTSAYDEQTGWIQRGPLEPVNPRRAPEEAAARVHTYDMTSYRGEPGLPPASSRKAVGHGALAPTVEMPKTLPPREASQEPTGTTVTRFSRHDRSKIVSDLPVADDAAVQASVRQWGTTMRNRRRTPPFNQ